MHRRRFRPWLTALPLPAGTTNAAQLVQIGPAGSSAGHASDPTVLSDVFARIGGATVGKATQTLVVNSSNVIGDDTGGTVNSGGTVADLTSYN